MTIEFNIKSIKDIMDIMEKHPEYANELIEDVNKFLESKKEIFLFNKLLNTDLFSIEQEPSFIFIPDGKREHTTTIITKENKMSGPLFDQYHEHELKKQKSSKRENKTMTERNKILGGKIECPTGTWDDEGNAIMHVYTQNKQISMMLCTYIEKCINNFDESMDLLQRLLDYIDDEKLEEDIKALMINVDKRTDVLKGPSND
ncbi:MAG: hypothetical protein GY793_08445 [Proteobacteria bacterium]|nr:hypothetical protein [Pseudomonadota bacterium]